MATADLGIRVVLTDSASSAFAGIGLNVGGLIGQLTALSVMWDRLSPQQQTVAGTALAAGLTFKAFETGLSDVVTAAGDLQASMIQVGINVKGARDRAADMQATLTNLADYSVYSSKQVADGFVLMGQKGFDAADLIDKGMGKSMVDLAEAINSDTVPAGNLLASAMQEWGASADQSAYYANALSFAYHNGVPDVNALQQALMQSGAQAVAMGLPFKDFVLLLDKLGQSGLTGAQAATSLRYMLGALADPTAKAQKEMADLGVIVVNQTTPALKQLQDQTQAYSRTPLELTGTLDDLNRLYTEAQKVGTLHTDKDFYQWALSIGAINNNLYDAKGNFKDLGAFMDVLGPKLSSLQTPEDFNAALEQLFSVRGGKGASALFTNLDTTKTKVDALSTSFDNYEKKQGALGDANATVSGFNATISELGSTMHSLAAQIGTPLIQAVTPFLQILNNGLNAIRSHAPGLLAVIGVFLVLGTVISGLVLVGTLAVAAFTLLAPVLAVVVPIVLGIVGAAAVLAVGITFIVSLLHQLSPIIHVVGSAIKAFFTPVFTELGKQLKTIDGSVFQSVGKTVQEFLVPALKQLMQGLHDLQPAFALVVKVIGIVIAAVMAPALITAVALFVGGIFALFHGLAILIAGVVLVISGVVNIIIGILNILVAWVKIVVAIIVFLFTGNFDQLKSNVLNSLLEMWHGVQSIMSGIMLIITGLITATVGTAMGVVGGFVSGVLNFFGTLEQGINAAIQKIVGHVSQLISSVKNIPGIGGLIGGVGKTLGIPGLAEGGVVTGPTLAVIGEGKEPEVVLPVSKLASFMSNYKGAGSGAGGTTVINNILDGKLIGQSVIDNTTRQLRRNGAGRTMR